MYRTTPSGTSRHAFLARVMATVALLALALVAFPTTSSASAHHPAAPTVISHITVSGNTMKYDVTLIRAKPGQRVTVILTNKPPGTLSHNWVLVKPGTQAKVAAAGLARGRQHGYLALGPDVLAHTAMIAPRKTTRTTFTAPSSPGDYPYICTFPGHYIMMHGILRVRR